MAGMGIALPSGEYFLRAVLVFDFCRHVRVMLFNYVAEQFAALQNFDGYVGFKGYRARIVTALRNYNPAALGATVYRHLDIVCIVRNAVALCAKFLYVDSAALLTGAEFESKRVGGSTHRIFCIRQKAEKRKYITLPLLANRLAVKRYAVFFGRIIGVFILICISLVPFFSVDAKDKSKCEEVLSEDAVKRYGLQFEPKNKKENG